MKRNKGSGLKRRRGRIVAISLVAVLALVVVGFLIYASDYYRADAEALAVLDQENVTRVSGDLIQLTPADFEGYDTDDDMALIFYPGAKVEFTAYLPFLDQIVEETGMSIFLVEMPFNMAIFASGKAASVMEAYPDIEHWYIGGHSMGAAMAGQFAQQNEALLDGMILTGAYLYGDFPVARTLTIYGSLNTSVEAKIDYDENVVVIEGGNHAYFGNYGEQRGDAVATISRAEQQRQAVEAIRDFVQAD